LKFAQNEDGELVHIILIWMNEEGKPVGLAAANRWGTGDKYVNGKVLKELTENFFIGPTLYSEPKNVKLVKNILERIKGRYNNYMMRKIAGSLIISANIIENHLKIDIMRFSRSEK